jgi:hypothetical protein
MKGSLREKSAESMKVGDLVKVDYVDPRFGFRSATLRAVTGKVGTISNCDVDGTHSYVEVFFGKPLLKVVIHKTDLTCVNP